MTLTLSDWVYEGIINEKSLLTMHPDYRAQCPSQIQLSGLRENRPGADARQPSRGAKLPSPRWRIVVSKFDHHLPLYR